MSCYRIVTTITKNGIFKIREETISTYLSIEEAKQKLQEIYNNNHFDYDKIIWNTERRGTFIYGTETYEYEIILEDLDDYYGVKLI